MKKISIILLMLLTLSCNASKNENKTKLSFPELAAILSPNDTALFFYTREIDKSLTTNCGVATPGGVATAGTPGAAGTPAPTTGGTGTTSSRRTILSQLVFKTGEILTMKFLYDSNQYQGALDQQQGFILTGGIFGATVKGTQGTVKWAGQSLGYIDESNNAAQALTFLIVDVNLKGTYTPGAGTASTPVECNTTGDGKCTSSITTTKCFTTDYVNCVNNSAAAGATAITITGNINCNAANVIPQ